LLGGGFSKKEELDSHLATLHDTKHFAFNATFEGYGKRRRIGADRKS
jgi:hypothetical protein